MNQRFLHDMAFPPQIKSKHRILDLGFPSYTPTLNWAHHFHTHSSPRVSVRYHTEVLFFLRKKIHAVQEDWASCAIFSSPCGNPGVHAQTCGRSWHKSTFQNMVHEQFAPLNRSQQLFKELLESLLIF